MQRAACKDMDPAMFFPARGMPTEDAKAICQRCPVQGDCLEYALVNGEVFGVWGGMSERQRRRIRGARAKARRA